MKIATKKRQQCTLLTTKFEEFAGVHHKNSFFKLQSEVAKYTFDENIEVSAKDALIRLKRAKECLRQIRVIKRSCRIYCLLAISLGHKSIPT